MKEALVINLTRMGDLIQTTPVICGLKERYPGVRVTLLVNSAFSEICGFIPFIDRLIVFDIRGLLRMLRDERDGIVKAYRYIEGLLAEVNDTAYDVAINFTHSTDSAVLMSLIRAREKRGVGIDEKGFSVKRHPWIRYFFNVIPGREYNPFHLCDMHLKVGGVMPSERGLRLDVPGDIEEWMGMTLEKEGVGEGELLIGLQLGASAEDKRWPVSSFAALARRLTGSLGARVVLTGSAGEAGLGREFEALYGRGTINLIGKTDLRELAALIKRCDLFISNDTGPLHIATAVGTRTVNISLASVNFRETGPYGEGHYVVAPDIPCSPCGFMLDCKDTVCKELIKAGNVFDLVERVLREGMLEGIEDSPLWRDVQVYGSYFDRDGLIDYRPLIRRPLKRELLYNHIYRRTWTTVLDAPPVAEGIEEACRAVAERLRSWYTERSVTAVLDSLDEDMAALTRLLGVAEEAQARVTLISREAGRPSPDIQWIKETWADVPSLDREIETIGHTCRPLRPMTVIFRYGKEALEGEGLLEQAEETRRLYHELKAHASMILEILKGLRERFGCGRSAPELTSTSG